MARYSFGHAHTLVPSGNYQGDPPVSLYVASLLAASGSPPTSLTPQAPGGSSIPAASATRDLPLMLTADDVAALIRSTRRAVYEQARGGRIPGAVRLGRKLLFRRDRLLQWIRESSVSSLGGEA